jgi:hypothetical protein
LLLPDQSPQLTSGRDRGAGSFRADGHQDFQYAPVQYWTKGTKIYLTREPNISNNQKKGVFSMYTKGILALLLAVPLSGCFIEVTSPSGGRVETLSGSLNCGAGEVCMVEVADTNFDQTFQAIPDPDMILDGWQKGRGYINPGGKDSFRLITATFTDSPLLMSFLASDEVFYLHPKFSPDPYPEIAAHRIELDQQGILGDLTAVLEYAVSKGLSTFNVDAIIRAKEGTTLLHARDNALWEGRGENRIEDFALKFNNSIVVPANPADVMYPDDYEKQKAGTITVEDPYCNLSPEQVVISKSHLGAYTLPDINVIPPRRPFRKFGHMKDVWQRDNPSFIGSCFADERQALAATLLRMQQANIDTIVLYPWTTIDNTVEPWRIINPAETQSSTIYDDDLAYIVTTAKSMGMKVFWRNQIQAFQDAATADYLPFPEENVENVLKTYDAMETYLAERGAFLEELGVDGVSLTPWFWAGFGAILSEEQFLQETRAHIGALKSTFSGIIMHDFDEPLVRDAEISALVDLWEHGLFYDEVAEVIDQLSVETALPKLRSQLEYYKDLVGEGQFVVRPLASSRGNFVTDNRYLEVTFCTTDYDKVHAEPGKCVQEEAPTDMSLQAILYEAALEAAFGIPGFEPGGISVEYWPTDGVFPSTTFPNLSYSVRNKPAEQVVRQWFGGQ